MIEPGFVALLRADDALSALVGGRIFAVLVPPDAVYPCISYSTMSSPPDVQLDLTAQEEKRFQVDCWAKNYADVKAMQDALHALLDGLHGDALPNGTEFDTCTRDVETDFYESDAEVFRAMSEYVFSYPSGK